jgi:hypothetical protein
MLLLFNVFIVFILLKFDSLHYIEHLHRPPPCLVYLRAIIYYPIEVHFAIFISGSDKLLNDLISL